MFVNDIFHVIHRGKLYSYADDNTLLFQFRSGSARFANVPILGPGTVAQLAASMIANLGVVSLSPGPAT